MLKKFPIGFQEIYMAKCVVCFVFIRMGGRCSLGPDMGYRASTCQAQCVSVCLCLYVCMSDLEE